MFKTLPSQKLIFYTKDSKCISRQIIFYAKKYMPHIRLNILNINVLKIKMQA